jgi:tripartite-type tricarboxylate transporter receptor subunit TctC
MKSVRHAVIAAFLVSTTVPVVARADYPERNIRLLYGFEPLGDSPAEFAQPIKAETPYWARVIKDLGIERID